MKVIGLIGGMSWNSTLEYYRIINESFTRRLGGLHSARMVLYNLDFDEIQRAQHEGRWDDIAGILVEAGNAVRRAGADFLVICTNTMHKVADDVEEKVGLPLLHIVDVTGDAIKELGLHRIGLLGTRFVMQEPFYQERFRDRFAIELLVPREDDIDTIHQIIYNELCEGKLRPPPVVFAPTLLTNWLIRVPRVLCSDAPNSPCSSSLVTYMLPYLILLGSMRKQQSI